MLLEINLDGNNIKLILKDGRKIVGDFSWTDEYTLSEKLLPNIDELLKKHKVKKEEIEKVTAKISKTSGVTSSRIVQTMVNTWNTAIEIGQE
jgi:hypothetical protein